MSASKTSRQQAGAAKTKMYLFLGVSPVESGRLVSIKAPDIPRGYYFLSHPNIQSGRQIKGFGSGMPLLAAQNLSYKGQPFYLLSGPDPTKLEALARKITINIEEPEAADDLVRPIESYNLEKGDFFTESRKAFKIISGQYNTENILSPIEQNLPHLSREKDLYTVACATGYPALIQDTLAECLGVAKKRIKIEPQKSSHLTPGLVVYPAYFTALAGLLASHTKKPVEFTTPGDGCHFPLRFSPRTFTEYKTALDENGRIMAMDIKLSFDLGAFDIISRVLFPKAALAACGAYHCEHFRVTVTGFLSHNPPLDFFPGLGEQEAVFGIEQHSYNVGEQLAIDPYGFKKRNLIKANEPLFYGQKTKRFEKPSLVLEDAVKRSDFSRKYAAFQANKKQRADVINSPTPLKGIGLAYCFHGIGLPDTEQRSPHPALTLEQKTDKSITLSYSLNNPLLAPLLAEWAKTSLASGSPKTGHLMLNPEPANDTGINAGDRPLLIMSKLADKISAHYKRNQAGRNSFTIKRVAKPSPAAGRRKDKLQGDAYEAFCWEATVVEVEVDPRSLIPQIKKIWITLGGAGLKAETINLKIHAGILANLFICHKFFQGPFNSPEYSPYPATNGMPALEINTFDFSGPRKGGFPKGTGNPAVIGVAPALCSAVSQALNLVLTKIPLNPVAINKMIQPE